jgi:hypothetical protein
MDMVHAHRFDECGAARARPSDYGRARCFGSAKYACTSKGHADARADRFRSGAGHCDAESRGRRNAGIGR